MMKRFSKCAVILLIAALLAGLTAAGQTIAQGDGSGDRLPVAAVVPADGAKVVRPDTPIEISFDARARAWVHVREQLEKGHFQASLNGAPVRAVYDPDRAAVRILPGGLLDRYTKHAVEFVLHGPDSGKHSGGGNREGWSKKTCAFSFETGSALHEPRHVKAALSASRVRVTDGGAVLELSFADDYGQPGWGARGKVILEERGVRKPGSAAAEPSEFTVPEGSDGKVKIRITDTEAEQVAYRVEISGPYPEDAAQISGELTFRPGPAVKVGLSLDREKVVVGQKAVVSGTAEDVYGNPVEDGTPVSASVSAGQISSAVTSGGAFALEFAAPTKKQVVVVTARVDQAEAQLEVPVAADVPARVTATPEKQEAAVGTPVKVVVLVEDQYGNRVEDGTRVTVTASGASVEPAEVTTQNGEAKVRVTSTQAGEVLVVACTDNGVTGSASVKFVAQQDVSGPVKVSGPDSVAYGTFHSLVVLPDGRVIARGDNLYGQLGNGTNQSSTSAVFVKDPTGSGYLTGVVQVAAGIGHSLALLSDGRVLAWGNNRYGQLGDGTKVGRNLPVFVLDPVENKPLEGVVQIAASSNSSFALLRDGRVLAWGENFCGKLGDGSVTDRSRPVFVKGVGGSGYLTGVSQVAAGGSFTVALLSDGRVAAWGSNLCGQLGQNKSYYDLPMSSIPRLVVGTGGSGTLTGVVRVAAGGGHCVALLNTGKVVAWGANGTGQLGNNGTYDCRFPVYVWGVNEPGPYPRSYLSGVTSIAAGSVHSLAVLSDGRVVSWGCDNRGELGDGRSGPGVYRRVPGYVLGVGGAGQLVATEVVASASSESSAALLADTQLVAWGYNGSGMLGDGTKTDKLYPVPVVLP